MAETPQATLDPDKVSKLFEAPDPSRSRSSINLPPAAKKAASKLGANKKARSSIRPLTDTDRAKIVDYYDMLAMAMDFAKPAVAAAIRDTTKRRLGDDWIDGPTRAELCADAWFNLAQQNDSVRRVILFFIEGGAWGAVFTANLPILLAALPDDILMKMLGRIGSRSTDDEDMDQAA